METGRRIPSFYFWIETSWRFPPVITGRTLGKSAAGAYPPDKELFGQLGGPNAVIAGGEVLLRGGGAVTVLFGVVSRIAVWGDGRSEDAFLKCRHGKMGWKVSDWPLPAECTILHCTASCIKEKERENNFSLLVLGTVLPKLPRAQVSPIQKDRT